MRPRTSPERGMSRVDPAFADQLTHKELEVTQGRRLTKDAGEITDDHFLDARKIIQCDIDPNTGALSKFQLKQPDGTWTEKIEDGRRLPLLYREYLHHLDWLCKKRQAERDSPAGSRDFLRKGRDVGAAMAFNRFLTPAVVEAGRAYAESVHLPGHIAVCDAKRNTEFFLDEQTFTPAFVRVRLQDDSFSPPFVFSLLPLAWQEQALRYYMQINEMNARQMLVAPEHPQTLDLDAMREIVARQNTAGKFFLVMIVGPSGSGKTTVAQLAREYAHAHGIDLSLDDTLSRRTSRMQRTGEQPNDNRYSVTIAEFANAYAAKEISQPYKTHDVYAYDLRVLTEEVKAGNVVLTVANSSQYLALFNDVRAQMEELQLPIPILVLIDTDNHQTIQNIALRDSGDIEKDQRIGTAGEQMEAYRANLQKDPGGLPMHVVINDHQMYNRSAMRLLTILHERIRVVLEAQ